MADSRSSVSLGGAHGAASVMDTCARALIAVLAVAMSGACGCGAVATAPDVPPPEKSLEFAAVKPPQREEGRRALIVLIDKSGSMQRGDKLQYVKDGVLSVAKTLKDNDLICVIGFDSQAFVVIPLSPVGKVRSYIDQMIGKLAANGQTYLMPALHEAERSLAKSTAQINHVVVVTDGATAGPEAKYHEAVTRIRKDGGATVSSIAIGHRVNASLLEAISKYGDGSYYQTDEPAKLQEILRDDVRRYAGVNR